MNSDKGVGEWWTPQNDFDRCPDQLLTKAGFLTGFDEEFRALTPVKVVTALNTVTDAVGSDVDPLEVTYDKFFPLSLEQMSINPQLAGEGETCEYWKRASQMSTKMQQGKTYPQIISYGIENHAAAQYVRLRSTNRGSAYHGFTVAASGSIGGSGYAINASRSLPACDLCVRQNR
jgi:hypothetical protein